MRNGRIVAFMGVVAVCVAGGSAAVVWSALASRGGGSPTGSLPDAPFVLTRTVGEASGSEQSELVATSLTGARKRTALGLRCDRVHYAAGHGICVVFDASFPAGYRAKLFDGSLAVHKTLSLEGFPSRVRVSSDGRHGAITTFVAGHSYADKNFSTRTVVLDLGTGREVGELEQYRFTRDGHTVTAKDRNFWGVTFAADGDLFYATMSTQGKTYLVRGRVSARGGVTLRENVECPSLSPNGRKLAYKKRVSSSGAWRFHVLDLSSGNDVDLAETRSVDDQIEWLDDSQVLYGVKQAVWRLPADGSGAPVRYLERADSPAVVR